MRLDEPQVHRRARSTFFFVLSSFALIALCTTLGFRWLGQYDSNHDATPILPNAAPTPASHWVDTFAAAPQYVNASERLPLPFNATVPFANTTIRQSVEITTGGQLIRIRLSNAFGLTDLPITRVTIAAPLPCCGFPDILLGTRNLDAATLQTVTFSGEASISIPVGGLVISDPIEYDAQTGGTIVINIYIEEGQESEILTSHLVSRTKSWFIYGDHTSTAELHVDEAMPARSWFIIAGIEVYKPNSFGTLVVFGDSMTEARKNTINSGIKWPKLLWRRLQQDDGELKDIGVINHALGGNRILADGKGPSATSRLDRDVMSHSGVKFFLVFQGIIDIGHANGTVISEQILVASRMIAFYKQIITRLHTFGIPVFGGTISPFICPEGYVGNAVALNASRETTRQTVNKWVRTSGWFDAVIDFDEMLKSPENATLLDPRYDTGDCLHFNDNGAAQIADKFPLDVFREYRDGVHKIQ